MWYGLLPSARITGSSHMGWWGGWTMAVAKVRCSKSSQFPVTVFCFLLLFIFPFPLTEAKLSWG